MRYVKLTVRMRSLDALYAYNKSGRSFWEDLGKLLHEQHIEFAQLKRSSFQYEFYFPYAGDNPDEDVTKMLSGLDVEKDALSVSSVPMRASDIESLQKSDVAQADKLAWFSDAAASLKPDSGEISPADHAPAADTKGDEETEEEEEEAPETHTVSAPAPGTSSAKPLEALADEAVRIMGLRDALLRSVRGQRHAVDEVTQTIFECDAFNRHNEKRRGPLATFLFTGPSGVGKTYLATQCAELLGIEPLIVNMSEFSDNLANTRFTGEHGEPAIVTSYVRMHPGGIIIFDEIEKAHINTIHLFLQILDSGVLRDAKINKDVSFRDTIVFITTNAGASLYEDPTVLDLSNVPRRVILEALRKDVKPGTKDEPAFPECITTRFANGHVVLFNHLEPFALMQIVQDELRRQVGLFEASYRVTVGYDPKALAAMVLYSTGGLADARTLRGTAKNMIVRELQDAVLQSYRTHGTGVNTLKHVDIVVRPEKCAQDVKDLFIAHGTPHVAVFTDPDAARAIRPVLQDDPVRYSFCDDPDAFKRLARGVVDYVLLDPTAGPRSAEGSPSDIEDLDTAGNDLFRYLKEFLPEVPVYLLDTQGRGNDAFSTLLAKGGRSVISWDPQDAGKLIEQLSELTTIAQINNATFTLTRSGKVLRYNCSQYTDDPSRAVIAFDRLSVGYAPSSTDQDVVTRFDSDGGVTFGDVVGCQDAKKALQEYCKFLNDPRSVIAQGKKIPRGVLLYGPPGTGKTMLAKAFANEAKAAFLPVTATSFFGMYVGQSEQNVRELFRRGRKYAPSVIFIDEVDAIGRMRRGGIGTAHNEDTLNAFLAEMDGFSTDGNRPVFVLAATNYDVDGDGPRVLDPAFVRRFDRRIFIGLPELEDRLELLKKTLRKHGVHFGEDHEKILSNLARRCSGLSNADLTTVIDIFLRSCEDKAPAAAELMNALDTFRFGEANEFDPKELKQTACHEAGHALVARLLDETPSFLTIIARKNFGGFMEPASNEKKMTSTFNELMDRVCTALAGRAAEIEVYGKDSGLNTGASSDLAKARSLVKMALTDFAMGDKLFTPGTDEECEELMKAQLARTADLIARHRGVLDKLTDLLYHRKSLDKTELEAFFAKNLGSD